VSDADQLQEEGIENEPNPHAHYIAYNRLKNTGWLLEEKEKWDLLVDMHPDAFMMIGAIADFANSRIRVAGAVVEVKSNLESAQRDPDTLAQGLANAARVLKIRCGGAVSIVIVLPIGHEQPLHGVACALQ